MAYLDTVEESETQDVDPQTQLDRLEALVKIPNIAIENQVFNLDESELNKMGDRVCRDNAIAWWASKMRGLKKKVKTPPGRYLINAPTVGVSVKT